MQQLFGMSPILAGHMTLRRELARNVRLTMVYVYDFAVLFCQRSTTNRYANLVNQLTCPANGETCCYNNCETNRCACVMSRRPDGIFPFKVCQPIV